MIEDRQQVMLLETSDHQEAVADFGSAATRLTGIIELLFPQHFGLRFSLKAFYALLASAVREMAASVAPPSSN